MEEFVEKILGGKRQADVNKFKAFLDPKSSAKKCATSQGKRGWK
jgi:hypothetical protein